ncbi:MAG: hypothetical protein KDK59_08615, partial [Simkania sp.]|nr:hypothetical protein [Simkania sp.]
EINFVNHQFRSLFCERSCARCPGVKYDATQYSVENDDKGRTSFACMSTVFDVCAPSGQEKMQMFVGSSKIDLGPLPFDNLYAFQNMKFSLFSISEKWFVECSFPRVEVVSNVEIKEGKALMNRVATLNDSAINFSNLKANLASCNIELIETELQGSCSEETFKEYQNINWATFFKNCKAVALKHAYAGRKNVPELKDLISALDAAQAEGKLNVKLVYRGHESSIALSGGIKNLFPEGELSIAIAKDSCPYNLIEEIERAGLQYCSGYYRTKFELKDRVFVCDGMTLHTCDPVDWENFPILTKDTCVDLLGMSVHDYCKYLE